MEIQELFNKAFTSFPLSVQFTPHDTSPALLYVTASAYSKTPNSLIGVNVALDDKPLGSLMLFANEASSHKALVTMLFEVEFTDQNPHKLTFTAATPSTVCDVNDTVAASLLMISGTEPFVWSTKGPIPAYTTYQPQISGPALLFMSGSVSQQGGGPMGVDVVINGKPAASSTFFGSTSSHQAFPSRFTQVMLQYSKDPVEIGFSTSNGDMTSDENDFYQLALIF